MQRQFFKLLPAVALGAVTCMTGLASATGVSVAHLAHCSYCSQDFAGHGWYQPAPGVYWKPAPPPGWVNVVAIPRPGAGFETPKIQPLNSGSGADGTSLSCAQATAPHGLHNDPGPSVPVPGAASSPLTFDLLISNNITPVGVQSAGANGSSDWSYGETTSPFPPHFSLVLLLSSGLVGLACLRRRKKRPA